MADASRRVLKAAAPVAAPASAGAGAGAGAPAVGAPPPPLAPVDQYYDDDYMQDYTLEQVIAAASPQAAPRAPPSPPRSLRMKVPYTIKFADVSKSFYILNYLANSVCKFPAGPTIFLPTNQAWSDALEGYKKSRSSGALYKALDAVASDRIKNAIVWAGSKTMINNTELPRLADKAKSCKTLTTHPIREAARTALYNLMLFHTAASRVTILNLDSQCTATGTSFKTAFNSNNMNFKYNSTDTGFISGSDPLASGATSGTASAVSMIDEPQKDYFYVNAVVFPSNNSSLPATYLHAPRFLFFVSLLSHLSRHLHSHFSSPSLPFLLPLTPIHPPPHSHSSSSSLPFLLSPIPPPLSHSSSLPFLLLSPIPPLSHSSSSLPFLLSPIPPLSQSSSSLPFLLFLSPIPPSLPPPHSIPPPPHSHFFTPSPAATVSRLFTALLILASVFASAL
ncbi:unnamed protein product [Closterium sp. NIES-65]|nr:unnamed protein product [Closterium sp. NIES-65]